MTEVIKPKASFEKTVPDKKRSGYVKIKRIHLFTKVQLHLPSKIFYAIDGSKRWTGGS